MPTQLYYISDRRQFGGDDEQQTRCLLEKITQCAAAGVDYVQLREKDLSTRALQELASKAMAALRGTTTKLLINSRTDIALACGAHGVHLPGGDLPASDVRAVFSGSGVSASVIGVSAHSLMDVQSAEAHGADLAVFAPVFEKAGMANLTGLEQLRQICRRARAAMPVFALGGITLGNARLCMEAGAAGIAAIRLFQENEVSRIVKSLKS